MYQKTDWRDHVTDKPGLYIITDNKDGTWTITPAGKVMQQGTPQDQEHFNNIENGVNLPSMSTFFYICEYLGVTPEEFFAAELADPVRLLSLSKSLRRLSSRQLELLEQLVQEMK